MSIQTSAQESPRTAGTKTAAAQTESDRNIPPVDECTKAHVAETSRLDDDDDACFDSIG